MLGTDDEGNLFSNDLSLKSSPRTKTATTIMTPPILPNFPGEPEMNAVTTDVNSISTPASDYWQADLFGVIPPPASAHA
eukprot:5376188-Pleurochrysis_carterae.AAC.1